MVYGKLQFTMIKAEGHAEAGQGSNLGSEIVLKVALRKIKRNYRSNAILVHIQARLY